MKQQEDHQMSRLEKALSQELFEVEVKIKELRDEASALKRQIGKASANRKGLGFSTRKNSVDRVLAENSVLEYLQESGGIKTTSDLYIKAKKTNSYLKENTFRTYLHRMKKKNLIRTAYKAGQWMLANNE